MRLSATVLLALASTACANSWDTWTGPCASNADCVVSYRTCDPEAGGQVAVLRSEDLAMREAVCPSCATLTCSGHLADCVYDPHAVALCDRGRCALFVTAARGAGAAFSRCERDTDCVVHDRCGTAGYTDCWGSGSNGGLTPIRGDHAGAYAEIAGCDGIRATDEAQCVDDQCELVLR